MKSDQPHWPRNNAALLPVPASLVRDVARENHLALVTMRAGHGTAGTMIALLRVLYLGYFVVEPEISDADRALFLEAELVLQQSVEAASRGQRWCVTEDALDAIEQLLRRADAMVGSVSQNRYLEAWNRLTSLSESTKRSPILGRKLEEIRA